MTVAPEGSIHDVAKNMLDYYQDRNLAADMAQFHCDEFPDGHPARVKWLEIKQAIVKYKSAGRSGRGGRREGSGRPALPPEESKQAATLRLTAEEWAKVRDFVAQLRGVEPGKAEAAETDLAGLQDDDGEEHDLPELEVDSILGPPWIESDDAAGSTVL